MSAIASITINDGQATPVAHTFNPIQSGNKSLYRENVSSLALIGQGIINVNTTLDPGTGLNKVSVTMALPALEVSTGANAAGYTASPKVGYTNKAVLTFLLPSRGTAAQRKDLRVLISNLLANAQIIDIIENIVAPF